MAGDIMFHSYSYLNIGNEVKFAHERKGQYFYQICLFTELVLIGYYDMHFENMSILG
jgi:lantibiotic modifying enzyme